MNGWNKSVDEVKSQIEKWNNGVCLYSVINSKNNKFHVDEKYASAYNEIEDVVHARI
ncbi:hypothetical protein [Sharpea azabuensis]|uniref:hypothetical protein n=1 Tax=Sharpea azabuensis TaxID=322505 RepID=UPI001569061A|nr:hypothetical protein [Sharpea azabuensis]